MSQSRQAFSSHGRHWRNFRYVYPVISRRSKGLSIGINLSLDAACNFNCVYCQVDRRVPHPPHQVDLPVLERELLGIAGSSQRLFDEPEFKDVPPQYQRLNDIAFSGDGEPTASPAFPAAARLAATARASTGVTSTRIVVITNGCFLTRPLVAEALAYLDQHNLDIWAKLDAGTPEYYKRVNRASHSLEHVLDGILFASRVRPVTIQSLFMRLHDEPPPASEIQAYAQRLRDMQQGGGRIRLVQIYTVARSPAEEYVHPLTRAELNDIADAVRPLGVPVECYA
ncbi:MAG: radical SAM protein [Planctomycetota bacterium]